MIKMFRKRISHVMAIEYTASGVLRKKVQVLER